MADSQRKTANLWNDTLEQGTISSITGEPSAADNRVRGKNGIRLASDTYTIATDSDKRLSVRIYNLDGTYNRSGGVSGNPVSITLESEYLVRFIIQYTNNSNISPSDVSQIMLDTGSTPLPYEPYGWVHSLRKLTTTTEAVENPLYSDGTAITAYNIKGNEEHTGTPTPSNPVDVNGVGVRTGNLFDVSSWAASVTGVRGNGSLSVSGNTISVTSNELQDAYTVPYTNVTGVYKIPVKPSTQYRIQGTISSSGSMIIFQNGATASWTAVGVVTTAADTTFLTIRFGVKSSEPLGTTATFENFMISEGASEKNYEPYGYKIPISSGGVTTNIYLGSTQTVRQIKKMTFTGNEDWQVSSAWKKPNTSVFFYSQSDIEPTVNTTKIYVMSDKFEATSRDGLYNGDSDMIAKTGGLSMTIRVSDSIATTVQDFKAWLASNPVTAWYVLATPTTATVNEPLMKIGDYADTLSNAASIPTTEGANSITVDTTVQPSEFTATWTGWHNAEVKEKSENLFDGVIEQGSITNEGNLDSELRVRSKNYISTSGLQYTISATGNANKVLVSHYDENKGKLYNTSWENIPYSSVYDSRVKYIRIIFKNVIDGIDQNISPADVTNVMVSTGSTALPYEPYWK